MLTNKLTGAGAADKTYIEDVFSTYLYTGTGSTQTINNGIDLAGKGGMVWLKDRTSGTNEHRVYDTVRGVVNSIATNTTAQQATQSTSLTAFNSNGFSIGASSTINTSSNTYASWTFRKAPKFFDVVTYTGDGVAGRTISHSLGIAPGMIIVKRTNQTSNWEVFHRSLPDYSSATVNTLQLNTTAGMDSYGGFSINANQTATYFTPYDASNASGVTYVAYLFAHDTTTDGLIQCGSYTGNGSTGQSITLGWEPQYVLIKRTSTTGDWNLFDSMRGGLVASGSSSTNMSVLYPNSSGVEQPETDAIYTTATGFQFRAGSTNGVGNASGATYIYMAIRRGPMRTPTDGTKVFQPNAILSTAAAGTKVTTGFPVDMQMVHSRSTVVANAPIVDRLRGVETSGANAATTPYISTVSIAAETTDAQSRGWDNVGFQVNNAWTGTANVTWNFQRAPGFFDVVCYTGTGVDNRSVTHNLGVTPELLILKRRDSTAAWPVAHKDLGIGGSGNRNSLFLNSSTVPNDGAIFSNGFTSSVFTVNNWSQSNASGGTYVAYLFASCPGVSKVGSYTGNGSSQTINCGFAAGARFVLIKRTDSTGDWYVWDTARGIVAATDPHLSLNTTAAEVTTDDTIDPDSSGFVVNQVAATNVNVSSATYIYLAIA